MTNINTLTANLAAITETKITRLSFDPALHSAMPGTAFKQSTLKWMHTDCDNSACRQAMFVDANASRILRLIHRKRGVSLIVQTYSNPKIPIPSQTLMLHLVNGQIRQTQGDLTETEVTYVVTLVQELASMQ